MVREWFYPGFIDWIECTFNNRNLLFEITDLIKKCAYVERTVNYNKK